MVLFVVMATINIVVMYMYVPVDDVEIGCMTVWKMFCACMQGCRGNSSGASCDVCVDTYYDADPSDPGLLCTPCPCSITTALE